MRECDIRPCPERPHACFVRTTVNIFIETNSSDFGEIGPKLLSDYIANETGAELRKWLFSPMFFNSIDWTETHLFNEPILSVADHLNDERVVGVHLWNARTHSLGEMADGTLLSILSAPAERLLALDDLFDRFTIDRNRQTGNRHRYARVYNLLLANGEWR